MALRLTLKTVKIGTIILNTTCNIHHFNVDRDAIMLFTFCIWIAGHQLRADHKVSQNHPDIGTSTQGRSIGDVRDKSERTVSGDHTYWKAVLGCENSLSTYNDVQTHGLLSNNCFP